MFERSTILTHADPMKGRFIAQVSEAVLSVPEVRSVTFAGSFVEKEGFAGISDIDIIVVVERLSRGIFDACRGAVLALEPEVLGLPVERVYLNDTFGPLKYDTPNVAVIHLMIYDVFGHRRHVLQSPFTCLDWERSKFYVGQSLRQIYPVLGLQPRHFFDARRSLANYIQDLAQGSISFRRYVFSEAGPTEVVERIAIDARHAGEYAYHIVRNLLGNYAKLLRGKNERLDTTALIAFWREALPATSHLAGWFAGLEQRKQARVHSFPPDTLTLTREFLEALGKELDGQWRRQAVSHLFFRHARTALNDGRLLGQRSDPSIESPPSPLREARSRVFSSPARRCRETAGFLVPDMHIALDDRLQEIDYGQAEGLMASELSRQFPDMVNGWACGEDPRFPGGENTSAVYERLNAFLADLPCEGSIVVTHNVVLRCLVGHYLRIPASDWYRVAVPHLEAIEMLSLSGRLYLNLTETQMAAVSDSVSGFRPY